MFEKMLNKITVRNIKANKIVNLIGAFLCVAWAVVILNYAAEGADTSAYHYSSEARNFVTFLTILGVVMLLCGILSFGLGLRMWVLQKNGKVCPKCEKVSDTSEIMCSKCHTDITYAMSVKEYLLNKPKVAGNPPAVTPNPPAVTPNPPAAGGETRRFCTACGKEVSGNTAFCPHCGSKLS